MLLKACVQRIDSNQPMGQVSFVIASKEKCYDRIGLVQKGVDRIRQAGRDIQERQTPSQDMVFLQQDTSSSAKGYDVQSQVEQTIKDVNTRSGKAMPADDKSGLIKSFSLIQEQMMSLSQQISQVEAKKAPPASGDQMTDLLKLVKQQTASIDSLGQQVKEQKRELDLLKEKNSDLVKQKNSSSPKGETGFLKQSFLKQPSLEEDPEPQILDE